MESSETLHIAEAGRRIKRYRTSHSFTQQQLADSIGTSRGYLAEIERGVKEPSFNFLRKLLETTGLSSEWVLRGEGAMFRETGEKDAAKGAERRDIEALFDAGLKKLDCGLYALGDKVYVPLSSVTACCGTGFEIYEDYNIGEAIAVSLKEAGTLRPGALPYAVRTEGRSMEGYGIKEGSTVIVNPAEDVYSGCVALVIYGDRASVKKVYDTPDGKDLLASNGQKLHVTYGDLSEDWGPRICGRVMVVIAPPDDGI
ncbi:MAG: helix-turn-helix domain-containing protein [Synergistaceae bacterium]|jgi:transcriptional regulator with XRE-family HTH domain|nr:helix-turn-helix domain-containing protein [Synergistaceae bacterium]